MEQEHIENNWLRADNFFIPLLLVVLSLLLMSGGQINQLLHQEENLANIKAGQDKPMDESRKVRSQFDSITTATAQLAAQGNPHAIMVLDELRKLGVTVDLPDGPAQ